MLDKFEFIFCLIMYSFSCVFIGWQIGVEDEKKKRKGQ